MRASGSLALVLALGCGGASVRPAEPEPTSPLAEVAVPEPVPASASAELVIDGVREPQLLDELEGWRLVGGAGTVALVGPDGHVRASHRFGYGGGGTNASFVGDRHAVVGNADYDGFRGPWSGRLVRWDLDADAIEQLGELGYSAPTMGRLGDRLLVGRGDGSDGVLAVTTTDVEPLSSAPHVVCAVGMDACFLYDVELTDVVRVDESGALRTEPAPPTLVPVGATGFALRENELVRLADLSTVPLTLAPGERLESALPRGGHELVEVRIDGEDGESELTRILLVPELTFHPADAALPPIAPPVLLRGALGIPEVVFAPSSSRIALGSSTGTLVLGPGGVEHRFTLTGGLSWRGETILEVGGRVVPFDLAVTAAGSTRTDAAPFVGYYDDSETLVEALPLAEWVGDGAEGPPPNVPPVCSDEAPRRCVRTTFDGGDGYGVAGWEIYDPARPRRVLDRIEASIPAVPRTVLPTAHRVRMIDSEGMMRVEPIGTGEPSPAAEPWTWRETRQGWVLRPIDQPSVLVGVPAGPGPLVERDFGEDAQVDSLTLVDDERVLAVVSDTVHVLRVPTLETIATYPLGPRAEWHCELDDVVERFGDVRIEGACPRPLPEDDYRTIAALISADRSFWAEPLGEVVVVHRVSDGATLSVRVTTEGLLAVGPGLVFEATGTIAEHLVLREAGPLRSAPITSGAEVRARLERPGLIAAFFSGAPLPTP